MSRFQPLGLTAIPRSSIESSHHASIDVSLKDLKTVSRRFAGFSTPYHNELQLLERIYYKGKNQHRSALFWHRVSEIRRLSKRIDEVTLSGFVEEIHYAFYEAEDRTNPKALRSAWKLAPNSSSCMSLMMRLRSVCLLVDQARARFRVAYETFIQQMRTATFIPLAMSLISITGRLNFLLFELREILGLLWQAVARIFETIAGPDTNIYRKMSFPLDPFGLSDAKSSSKAGIAKTKLAHKRDGVPTGFTEDFGSIVSRDLHRASAGSQTPKASSSAIGQTLLTEVEPSLPHHDYSRFTETFSPRPTAAVSLPTIPKMSCQIPAVTAEISSRINTLSPSEPIPIQRSLGEFEGCESGKRLVREKRKVTKVKRRKNADEIDNIFGF